MIRLIVNLPAFNEAKNIGTTVARIPRTIAGVNEVFVQVQDDGSTDDTIAAARAAGADFIYTNGVNRGVGITFKNAVENALDNGADIFVNMDADGQFDPNDIAALIAPILNNTADIVSASRFGEKEAKDMPKVKYYLNLIAARIIGWFLSHPIDDLTCGYRAYSRAALLRLNIAPGFTYTQETIIDAIGKNMRLQWIPVTVTYFANRKSRVVKSITSYVGNSGKIILETVRDIRPMKFFGFPAFLILFAAVACFIYFLCHYITDDFKITPNVNSLLVSIALFIIGVQFLVFAFIADMITSLRKLVEDHGHTMRKWRYKK